jgi:hypothetical protein
MPEHKSGEERLVDTGDLAQLKTQALELHGQLAELERRMKLRDDLAAKAVRTAEAQLAEAERREKELRARVEREQRLTYRVAERQLAYKAALEFLTEPLGRVVQTTVALTPREAAALLKDIRAALQDHLQEQG